MIKGNKGEWSEFYTLLNVLADRQISAADENLQKIENRAFPILKVVREEASGKIEYDLLGRNEVKILETGKGETIVNSSDLKPRIAEILQKIKGSTKTTFEIPAAEELSERFNVKRLKAGNSKKEDIVLKIHDYTTGAEPEVGFSIKSMLGGAATLLNASGATNFIYKIVGLSEDKMGEINSIETRSRIRDRLLAVSAAGGAFSYHDMASEIFNRNLRKIEGFMPEIVAELILAFYLKKGRTLPELAAGLGGSEIKVSVINFNKSDYEYKLKNLLHSVALGMVPNTEWDGLLRVHGGCIVIRQDGDIICYTANSIDDFKRYLFNNTKLETASTSRHDFGKIYKQNGDLFIKLNLQIRFTH